MMLDESCQTCGHDPRPGPVEKTRHQIEEELVEAMKGILGCGVTCKALNHPSSMDIYDIVCDLHLYERLGTAFVALGALKGYKGCPRGFEVKAPTHCEDCGSLALIRGLAWKSDHHGGQKFVCVDREACHRRYR